LGIKTKFTRKRVLLFVLSIDIAVIIVASTLGSSPGHYFSKEHSLLTYHSSVQLLAISFLAFLTYLIRKKDFPSKSHIGPFSLWLIVAIGFLFLAFDEVFMAHENMDEIIHSTFQLKETGVTDRIDDVIVLCYGICGLVVLYIFREEFTHYRTEFPLVKLGFSLLFVAVFLDILTNRDDVLSFFISTPHAKDEAFQALKAMEKIFEILAEGVFVATFYYFREIAGKIPSSLQDSEN